MLVFCYLTLSSLLLFGKIHVDYPRTSYTFKTSQSLQKVSYKELGSIVDNNIIVSKPINLQGRTCEIPSQFILNFKGGQINNGTLIGNKTKIICNGVAFDKVTIKGSWDVPEISTKLFADIHEENSLKNVFALADSQVKNVITIDKGNYTVKAKKRADACLVLCDNTELVLNGTIRLTPNEYPRYDIIKTEGKNISIRGDGTIMGDKHTHLGTEGEWGMGIRFDGAENVSVTGLTIKDCWGDCIYVGGNSKQVLIENCLLDHGRRQGISVTKADSVTIRSCKITNVKGTNPQYAIDLEPNANDTVNNVLIENVEIENCEGGILATLTKEKALTHHSRIGNVIIRECHLSVNSKYPLRLNRCKDVRIEKCIVNASDDKAAIYSTIIDNMVIRNNTININKKLLSSIKNVVKDVVGKKKQKTIELILVKKKELVKNEIIER